MPLTDVRVGVLRGNTDKSRPLSPPGLSPCSLLSPSVSTAMADDWMTSRESDDCANSNAPNIARTGASWG